jgi:hypothetical protein
MEIFNFTFYYKNNMEKTDLMFKIVEIESHLKIVSEDLEKLKIELLKDHNPDIQNYKGKLVRLKDTIKEKLKISV